MTRSRVPFSLFKSKKIEGCGELRCHYIRESGVKTGEMDLKVYNKDAGNSADFAVYKDHIFVFD